MNFRTNFDTARTIQRDGFSIAFENQRVSAFYRGAPIPLSPVNIRIMERLLGEPATASINAQTYAELNGNSIEDKDQWEKSAGVLKVQISLINKTLKEVCGDIDAPEITPLYEKGDQIYKRNPGTDKQAYILAAPISQKPDSDVVLTIMPPSIWRLHVDVAALGEAPDDLRVYKRRILDWDTGVVLVGKKHIPLTPLKKMAIAHAVNSPDTPFNAIGLPVSTIFGNAVLPTAAVFSHRHYRQILANAAREIADTANRPDIAVRLMKRSDCPASAAPPTLG